MLLSVPLVDLLGQFSDYTFDVIRDTIHSGKVLELNVVSSGLENYPVTESHGI